MRGGTHMLAGAVTAAPMAYLVSVEPGGTSGHWAAGALLVLGAAAGEGPDLDHPDSPAGKVLPYVMALMPLFWPLLLVMRAVREPIKPSFSKSGWLFARWVLWHRGPVHSPGFGVLLMVVVSVLTAWWWGSWWAGSLAGTTWIMGWMSHLVLDVAQRTEMPWLWPLSNQRFRPEWAPVLSSAWLERGLGLGLFVALLALIAAIAGPVAVFLTFVFLWLMSWLSRLVRL
jgi:hypothetical protein